jgi:hypothetical protein
MQSVSKQRNCQHVYDNRCFPWCLCRVLLREVNSDANSVGDRQKLSKIMKIQMYVQLDKEKPGIRSTRRLNLEADRPTTVQVSDCRFWRLNKLMHRLLHSPALTEIPVYIRTKCWVVFCESCVKCAYFLLNPWGEVKECNVRWNSVW